MRKAVLKRFRITKTGKVLRRFPGQNHFNAKASRRNQLSRSKLGGINKGVAKKLIQHAYMQN